MAAEASATRLIRSVVSQQPMLTFPRLRVRKAAAVAAGIGGGSGLLYSIADCALQGGSFHGLISVATVLVPFGVFLGWWAWLFWLALKADRSLRYLAVAGFLALAVLIFILQRPNLTLAQRFHQEGVPTQAVVSRLGFAPDVVRFGLRLPELQ